MDAPPAAPPETAATAVLVVDDDFLVREILVRLLTAQGYRVAEADGTDAALALLDRDGEVPLVISDLHMPGRDGLDAMTTNRAYRAQLVAEVAIGELQQCAGKQFDPAVVAAFRSTFPDPIALPTRV